MSPPRRELEASVAEYSQRLHRMGWVANHDGNVSVRLHGKGNIGAKPKAEVVADILAAIKERRA